MEARKNREVTMLEALPKTEGMTLELYKDIELTPEEEKAVTAAAILRAKSLKAAELYRHAYAQKICKPAEYKKMNYAQLRKFVLQTNPDFVLDEWNSWIFELLCMFFSGDEAFEKFENGKYTFKKGIILYGPIGCGKTKMMKMFAVNSFRPFEMNPCRVVADKYSKKEIGEAALYEYSSLKPEYPERNFGLNTIGRCHDDIGREEDKQLFGNWLNVMQDIVYKIYDSRLFSWFHLTTNLTGKALEERYGAHARSRMREMYNVIAFHKDSPDRRM